MKYLILLTIVIYSIFFVATANQTRPPLPAELGGETTPDTRGSTNKWAFSLPADNIAETHLRDFFFGNRVFNTNWVEEPASVSKFDGVGPVFNRVSCSGCHLRDGRGQPTTDKMAINKSMLLRLSIPGSNAVGGPKPHPIYGGQLQESANLNVPYEGKLAISYEYITGTFEDGSPYELRKPIIAVTDLQYGTLSEEVMTSARVAPAVIGVGLLEAIPEETLLAFADPEDSNEDGISGKLNYVWDIAAEETTIGRFGWKAGNPSLRQQNADASMHDIGLTNILFPEENCTPTQKACSETSLDNGHDLDTKFLDKMTHYTSLLAVPPRRNMDDPMVQQGEKLFYAMNCASCHRTHITTSDSEKFLPELRAQWIHPFTDLLLHDMGEGLADHRPEYLANGQEWRTPPLWGIGLVETVNGHTFFLHDGRARNIEEAILWHGGEAKASQKQYLSLDKTERAAVLAFLNSL